jgi:bisanhydrobacterioruberin hydratase
MRFTPLQIAVFLALLFHVSGAIGILYSPYAAWFIAHTPLTLLLMAVLLFWNQPKPWKKEWAFLVLCFAVGFGVEVIGVNTGFLFGHYQYGAVLGPRFLGVPWLIGINWWVTVSMALSVTHRFSAWALSQMPGAENEADQPQWVAAAQLIDAALLATFFDWILEPVAMQLGFWQWSGNVVPFYNYVCWFLVSLVLVYVSRKWKRNPANPFALHLLLIESIFFITLRIFLP